MDFLSFKTFVEMVIPIVGCFVLFCFFLIYSSIAFTRPNALFTGTCLALMIYCFAVNILKAKLVKIWGFVYSRVSPV